MPKTIHNPFTDDPFFKNFDREVSKMNRKFAFGALFIWLFASIISLALTIGGFALLVWVAVLILKGTGVL